MSASKKNQPTAAKPEEPHASPSQEVTKRAAVSAPAFMGDQLYDYAGAGVSDRQEDNVVPFLYVAQKGHPQVNKRDPLYIPGLEPGMVFDTSNRRFWRVEGEQEPLRLIQFHMDTWEVEWGIRGTPDQGYKGRYRTDDPIVKTVVEKPRDNGIGVVRMLPSNRQLTWTAYHYFIIADDLRPVAMPMASSFVRPHRMLNTMLRDKKMRRPGGGLVIPPCFATMLSLRTVWVQSGENDWFVPVFEDLGYVTEADQDAYTAALEMHKSAMADGIKVAEPMEDGGASTASNSSDQPNQNQDGDPDDNPDDNPTDDSPL